jgi:hypothetical protein
VSRIRIIKVERKFHTFVAGFLFGNHSITTSSQPTCQCF